MDQVRYESFASLLGVLQFALPMEIGKQVGITNRWRQTLVGCVLFLLMIQANTQVPFKPINDAKGKKAVCIDGSRGGYFHSHGSGKGANNWLLFLMGGGWCWEGSCAEKVRDRHGSTVNATSHYFTGLYSENQTLNPDFHNWNKVVLYYCDGASFLGDNEAIDNGTLVQLRGSRIYNSIMKELLEAGMKNADNAILSGGSAGGLATILHCDDFRALLPNANRVKCFSDGGFLLHGKNLPFAWRREWMVYATTKIHNLTSYLPSYCTSKMDAHLCLFPEYLVSYVKTPLFLVNSAFDKYQIHDNMNLYPTPPDWDMCISNTSTCTSMQAKVIKDFGRTFKATIKSLGNNPSRGLLITSCFLHGMVDSNDIWDNKGFGLMNVSIRQTFTDWYFDRVSVKLITRDTFPKTCI